MKDKKLFGTVTVGTKGQIVIPVEAREEFNIKTGDRMYVIGSTEGKWLGLLSEEQVRILLEHINTNAEFITNILKNISKK